MNKNEFQIKLREGLAGLPPSDIEEQVSFYCEMIDDRIEEGLSEEDAIAALGPIEDIVTHVTEEIPFARIVTERVRPKRALRVWEIVLIVLGAPLWIPLLAAAFVTILSVYAAIGAMLLSLWGFELALIASVLACIWGVVVFALAASFWQALAMFGATLACAGAAILMFFGCLYATKGLFILTKKILLGMKGWFIKKEEA